MINLEERNLEIVQARKKVATYQEIADSFGLSLERVRQIAVRSELEERQRLHSERIKEAIRLSDDIEKKCQRIY